MLKLPRDVKFRNNFVNAVTNHFDPSDLFIHLVWLPRDHETKSRVHMSCAAAVFSKHIQEMVQEIQKDMLGNHASGLIPNFMVLFEYGYDQFIHAYIMHELYVSNEDIYQFDPDWYSKNWQMLKGAFPAHIQSIGNMVNVPRFLTEVMGLDNDQKKFYFKDGLCKPGMNSYFKDPNPVTRSRSGRYLEFAPVIDLRA